MNGTYLAATCAILASWPGLAAADATTKAERAATRAAAQQERQAAAPAKVPEVAIEAFARLPVCRRHVPTGTRIAGERCTSNDATTAALRKNEQDLTRQDVEMLRQRQMIQEQARQTARAEALRRRAAGF
jgi:hypothetical protein